MFRWQRHWVGSLLSLVTRRPAFDWDGSSICRPKPPEIARKLRVFAVVDHSPPSPVKPLQIIRFQNALSRLLIRKRSLVRVQDRPLANRLCWGGVRCSGGRAAHRVRAGFGGSSANICYFAGRLAPVESPSRPSVTLAGMPAAIPYDEDRCELPLGRGRHDGDGVRKVNDHERVHRPV